MLELMHMRALGLDFKSRNEGFLLCSQLWFSSNNSARRKQNVRLVLTCLTSPLLTHFGRIRQRMGGAEVRIGRRGMIQQGNRPCLVVWPLAAAERPQMQLFA